MNNPLSHLTQRRLAWPSALFLVVCLSSVMMLLAGGPFAEAQVTGRASGSISVSNERSVQAGGSVSYTVKVKDLAAGALANYGVSIHASGGIRLDSSCSGARYMTHDPENESESFSIMVYGTTVGEGTLTATLVFADDDAFEGEVVASAADAIDVELTVKFTDSSYSVDEGDEEDVTVELSGENCETLEIPVNITLGTAESTDFSVSGLSSSGSLSFSSGDTSESFTISTFVDEDCEPERLELSFGSLPDGVEEGSPSTATFQIRHQRRLPHTHTHTHTHGDVQRLVVLGR